MFNNFTELFKKSVYNDTMFDRIRDMTLVTIDRTEEKIKSSYQHIVMTVPNNEKLIEDHFINKLEYCLEKANVKKTDSLILVPNDTFTKKNQIGFERTKDLLNESLINNKMDKAFITAKTNLKHPDNLLMKFIFDQEPEPVNNSFNCYEIKEDKLFDKRLEKVIERDSVKKIL